MPSNQVSTNECFEFPEDYPFAKEVAEQQDRILNRPISYIYEKLTVHLNQNVSSDAYTKLYRNREILNNLSSEACKIIVFIGGNIEYKCIRIQLCPGTIPNINARNFYKGIKDLIGASVLKKIDGKKAWYWVNVTVLVVGNIHN